MTAISFIIQPQVESKAISIGPVNSAKRLSQIDLNWSLCGEENIRFYDGYALGPLNFSELRAEGASKASSSPAISLLLSIGNLRLQFPPQFRNSDPNHNVHRLYNKVNLPCGTRAMRWANTQTKNAKVKVRISHATSVSRSIEKISK